MEDFKDKLDGVSRNFEEIQKPVRDFISNLLWDAINLSQSDPTVGLFRYEIYLEAAFDKASFYEKSLNIGSFAKFSNDMKAANLKKELSYWQEESKHLGMPKFKAPSTGKHRLRASYKDAFVAFCMVKYLEWRIDELLGQQKTEQERLALQSSQSDGLKKTKERDAPTTVLALVLWYQLEAGLLPHFAIGSKDRRTAICTWAKKMGVGGTGRSLYNKLGTLSRPENREPKDVKKAIEALKDIPEAHKLALMDLPKEDKESDTKKR